jgi:hypothetical protein
MYNCDMATVRIFKTRKEAELAKKIVEEGGFLADITEDKFNGVPIQKFGVRARFRLNVAREDYFKVANYLAKRLRESRLR